VPGAAFETRLPGETIPAEDDGSAVPAGRTGAGCGTAEPRCVHEPGVPVTAVRFTAPEGAPDVEIAGTRAIPEFPTGG